MKKSLIMTITLLLSFLFVANPTFAYTVQQGDTLTKIAAENNLTLEELQKLNPKIENPDLIYIGDTLITEEPNKIEESVVIVNYIDYELELLEQVVTTEVHKTEGVLPEVEVTSNQKEVLVDATTKIQKASAEEKVNAEEMKKTEDSSLLDKYSDYEIDLLARLVRAEAQVEPFEGKVAVACVVLNRVESPQFPDTIKEVIYESRQFQPVSNGEINKPADEESIAAVKAALTEKRDLALGSLFFYNPTIATSRWLDTRPTTVVIGQHVFKN